MSLRPVSLLATLLALSCPACGLLDPKPKYKAADSMAVIPVEFLFSRYDPLNRWLDTPVRVQIMDVPLSQVILLPCLKGINYRVIEMPEDDPVIFLDKIALTRRQLLWSLAQDYQLHLTPIFDVNGGPACIEIRSRAARNEARSRGDS